MFIALWKLFTNEQSFNEFITGHGNVVLRVVVAGLGEVAKNFGSSPELYWLGTVAQVLALAFQGGDRNLAKS